eukprot:jgi/Mesvir1/20679/Mv25511-RA.1
MLLWDFSAYDRFRISWKDSARLCVVLFCFV